MKNLRYWIRAIAGDGAVLGLLAFHMATGSEGAGRAFQVTAWSLAVLQLIFGLFGDRSAVRDQRPPGFVHYHVITEVCFVWMTAWAGFWALSITWLIGTLLAEGARTREPKKKPGA